MNKRELKTLRGQLLLLGGLFAGCLVAAAVIAASRNFFEKFLGEKYQPLPAHLAALAQAAAEDRFDQSAFAALSPADRLVLYDDWMARADPPPAATPGALLAADAALYLARVERTLVCGRPDQRLRALQFLELAGARQAVPLLREVRQWALKRKLPQLGEQIAETINRIEQRSTLRPIPASSPSVARLHINNRTRRFS